MRNEIFCLPQVKTRPIIGRGDPVLQKEWNKIRKHAEIQFLECQQTYTNKWSLHYQNKAQNLVDNLRQEMSNEPHLVFQETEQAINTEANSVRSTEYCKLNGRWSNDLATHVARKHSVQLPTTQRPPRHNNNEESQHKKSGTTDPKRMYKKAQVKLGKDHKSDQHDKYISKVKAGRGQVDPEELTNALNAIISKRQ